MMLDVARRPIDAVSHHVRVAARIAPGRPALWMGLRMAAAMALPLMLSPWLDPVVATSASLAGYFITLVDKGGAYRTRARAMAIASGGTIVAAALGVSIAGTPLAGPVVIAVLTASAFAQHWGPAGVSVANPIAVMLAVAAFRVGPAGTLEQVVAGIAFGAGWAMVLALFLWPVRVYRPGRRAVAAVLDELAALAAAIADSRDRTSLLARHRRVREQIEVARQIMVATLRGRGERDRGERLLAAVHVCDRVFGRFVALEELLDDPEQDPDPIDDPEVARILALHAEALSLLGTAILDERPGDDLLARIDEHIPTSTSIRTPQVASLLAASSELLATARRLIGGLDEPSDVELPEVAFTAETMPREDLRDLLRLDSAVFRHAARVGIASALALAIAAAVHLAFGYWIVLTVFLLLQPYRSATRTRAIQRGLGTVAGALFAAAVVAVVPEQRFLIALTVALAAIGASVMQLNYGLFALFVTPTFVLLAEMQTRDFTLFEVRIAYTLVGAAIAVLASMLLWPARERALLDDQLAAAVDKAALYLAAVRIAISTKRVPPSHEVIEARRAFGVALGNAEVALDRFAADRAAASVIEPRMSVIATARRLGGAISALAATRALVTDGAERAHLVEHTRALEATLADLGTSLRTGAAPIASSIEPTTRMATHVDALHDAVERARLTHDAAGR